MGKIDGSCTPMGCGTEPQSRGSLDESVNRASEFDQGSLPSKDSQSSNARGHRSLRSHPFYENDGRVDSCNDLPNCCSRPSIASSIASSMSPEPENVHEESGSTSHIRLRMDGISKSSQALIEQPVPIRNVSASSIALQELVEPVESSLKEETIFRSGTRAKLDIFRTRSAPILPKFDTKEHVYSYMFLGHSPGHRSYGNENQYAGPSNCANNQSFSFQSWGSQGQGCGQIPDRILDIENDPDQDPSSGDEAEDDPQPGTYNGKSGFSCIFCRSAEGGTNPTRKCARPRKYTSRLKKHHFVRKHPGGPFGCCQFCFSISENSHRFTTQQEVNGHEAHCDREICIDEDCVNYDRVPSLAEPCTHAKTKEQRQIWRMWYRRAFNKGRYDHVPEPGEVLHSINNASTSQVRHQPNRPHLRVPTTPVRPNSSPPTNPPRHPVVFNAGLDTPFSPSVNPLTPVGTQAQDTSSDTGPEQRMHRLASNLLSRLLGPEPFWTPRMTTLYEDTVSDAFGRVLNSSHLRQIPPGRLRSLFNAVSATRELLEDPASRNMHNWMDLRTQVDVTVSHTLPERPPAQWADQFTHTAIDAGQNLQPQSSDPFVLSGPSHYPIPPTSYTPTLDFQEASTGSFDLGAGVEDRLRHHNVTYDQEPFISNQFLDPNMPSMRVFDTQSIASAPIDSGVYSAEGSTAYSGNGKGPMTRRPSAPANVWPGPL
ncbi:hypothetical protein HII31_10770 [Pseudocercospora fuligena]|uniref:Uncharacterized protein n=1 Tax=Pseudocercospora fuligena TaxID=685502 RepID=A0A8H6VE16_9PEZI|nr:hypothetical protein HII31_10770 [Pseudocercospora fuligena]